MTHVHIMTPRHNSYDIFQATVNKIKTNYVTADDDTLSSYRTILVNQYNDIVDHINVKQPRANAENKEIYGRNRIFCRKLLIQALDLLKCTYDIDLDLKSHIVLQDISEPNTGEIESIPNLANLFPEQVEQIQNNMADLSAPEFLKLVSSHINKPYTGDPLSLNSFIDSIRLLETLATTAALRTLFVTAIKTKIDGDAREYITNEHITVNGIIEALQANCTPDASKVIEGRMLSLKLKMGEQQDFAEKTEKLAESLRRSLIVEGITHAKANEMAIDKTIEVCRANAKSDLVKSVLEAAKFQKPNCLRKWIKLGMSIKCFLSNVPQLDHRAITGIISVAVAEVTMVTVVTEAISMAIKISINAIMDKIDTVRIIIIRISEAVAEIRTTAEIGIIITIITEIIETSDISKIRETENRLPHYGREGGARTNEFIDGCKRTHA